MQEMTVLPKATYLEYAKRIGPPNHSLPGIRLGGPRVTVPTEWANKARDTRIIPGTLYNQLCAATGRKDYCFSKTLKLDYTKLRDLVDAYGKAVREHPEIMEDVLWTMLGSEIVSLWRGLWGPPESLVEHPVFDGSEYVAMVFVPSLWAEECRSKDAEKWAEQMPSHPRSWTCMGDSKFDGNVNVEYVEGVKFDADKPDMTLLPYEALAGAAHALMYGEKKYGRNNWCKGLDATRQVAAVMRHVTLWTNGVDTDAESGLHHLDHALAMLMMARSMLVRDPNRDTRGFTDATLRAKETQS